MPWPRTGASWRPNAHPCKKAHDALKRAGHPLAVLHRRSRTRQRRRMDSPRPHLQVPGAGDMAVLAHRRGASVRPRTNASLMDFLTIEDTAVPRGPHERAVYLGSHDLWSLERRAGEARGDESGRFPPRTYLSGFVARFFDGRDNLGPQPPSVGPERYCPVRALLTIASRSHGGSARAPSAVGAGAGLGMVLPPGPRGRCVQPLLARQAAGPRPRRTNGQGGAARGSRPRRLSRGVACRRMRGNSVHDATALGATGGSRRLRRERCRPVQ